MPKMRGPSGQVRDLSYDEDGEKKAKELEGKVQCFLSLLRLTFFGQNKIRRPSGRVFME